MKIKKGDKFECILDYEMEDGVIVFFNGKIYTSKKDNTLPSFIDETHVMNEEQDFKLHFKRVKSKIKKQSKKDFAIGFAEWKDKNYYQHSIKNDCFAKSEEDFTSDKTFKIQQLLEIYIKEKGL